MAICMASKSIIITDQPKAGGQAGLPARDVVCIRWVSHAHDNPMKRLLSAFGGHRVYDTL